MATRPKRDSTPGLRRERVAMAGRRSERRRAVVLDRTKLGEQDLILTMVSLEGEQLRAVAKGARKPGSRLAARTELFCDVDMLLSYGRGLAIVSEAQVMDAHEGVRGDLERLSCASAICEVARLTCYENMQDAFLHPLLSRTLTACEQASDRNHLDLVYSAYVFKVLSHAGWRPELEGCIACGEPSATRFSVTGGGVLCESCARDVAGAKLVTDNLIAWIDALIKSTFDALVASDVDGGTAAYLVGVAHEWATTHLESRLRASEFFAGI